MHWAGWAYAEGAENITGVAHDTLISAQEHWRLIQTLSDVVLWRKEKKITNLMFIDQLGLTAHLKSLILNWHFMAKNEF